MGKEAFEKKMQNNPLYIMERQQNATQLVNLLLIYITPYFFFFFFFDKNVVFPAQAEYSYLSADLRLKILFYHS